MIDYSILISVYFRENPKHFEVSLESLLNQTVKSNDIVLVCDGPLTTELEEVIAKYQTNSFNIIRLAKNCGLGIALNEGLKHCKNNIVLRADSDDYSLPTRAEIELDFMLKYDYDVVSSYVSEFTNSIDDTFSVRKVPLTQKRIDKFCKTRNPFNHPASIFKKQVVTDVGGYLDFPFYEDYYLWARIIAAKKYKYGNCSDSLVFMRIGDSDQLLKRRFSKDAIVSGYSIVKKLKDLKILNWFECVSILTLKKIFNLLPFKLKKTFYLKLLRRKKR